MVSSVKDKKAQAAIEKANIEFNLNSLKSSKRRAASFVFGTAFNGMSEIGMRANNGEYYWAILSQKEVVELAEALAASVGCEATIKTKSGKKYWRRW